MKPKFLHASLILLLVPAAVFAVATVGKNSLSSPASVGLTTISITAYGNATQIGRPPESKDAAHPIVAPPSLPVVLPAPENAQTPFSGDTSAASVSITATVVERNTTSAIGFSVDGTSLTIGGVSYQVINGTGIFNQHSLVVVLHATVKSGDWTGTLILIGHADQAMSNPGNVSLTFRSPASKLSSKFFLELQGTLTLH